MHIIKKRCVLLKVVKLNLLKPFVSTFQIWIDLNKHYSCVPGNPEDKIILIVLKMYLNVVLVWQSDTFMRFPLEFTTYIHCIIKKDMMTHDKRILPFSLLGVPLMSPSCDGITGKRRLMTLLENKQTLYC